MLNIYFLQQKFGIYIVNKLGVVYIMLSKYK